jgi:DNA-binding response OmpR family regulator
VLVIALPTIGREIAARLGSDRFEIHRSPDLESAVEVIRRIRPRLVVAAVDKRKLTSDQIIDPIRAHIAGLPVIILTSGQPPMTDKDVIVLPVDADGHELARAVSLLLGGIGGVESKHGRDKMF